MPVHPEHGAAVAVGFFDGVHLGHQATLRAAANVARAGGYRNLVLTFDPHPMDIIDPGRRPHLLMTRDRRRQALVDAADADVQIVRFGDTLRRRSPDDFVDEFLVERLAARHIVVGANFRFGDRASGDVQKLRALGATRGFTVTALDLLEVEGRVVSSTAIREAIHNGQLAVAASMLGRPYGVDGMVVCSREEIRADRGRVVVPARSALPPSGSFSGRVLVRGGRSIACTLDVLPSHGHGSRDLDVQMTGGQTLAAGRVTIEFDSVDRLESASPAPDVTPPPALAHGFATARSSRP